MLVSAHEISFFSSQTPPRHLPDTSQTTSQTTPKLPPFFQLHEGLLDRAFSPKDWCDRFFIRAIATFWSFCDASKGTRNQLFFVAKMDPQSDFFFKKNAKKT